MKDAVCSPGDIRRFFLICVLGVIGVSACNPGEKQPKERSLKDVENAIAVINDRREAERRVITDQLRQIESLERNIALSNTDGMKEKIRKDIAIKRLAIEKAERNIVNQSDILIQLEFKRDSLQKAGEN